VEKKVSAIPCLSHAVWKIFLPSFSSYSSSSVFMKGVQSLLDEGPSAVGLRKEVRSQALLSPYPFSCLNLWKVFCYFSRFPHDEGRVGLDIIHDLYSV
jgi:hypothetical protein